MSFSHLGRDCIWSGWSQWDSCTATCGGGTRTRYQTMLRMAEFGGECPGESFRVEDCNMADCPTLSKLFIIYLITETQKGFYLIEGQPKSIYSSVYIIIRNFFIL